MSHRVEAGRNAESSHRNHWAAAMAGLGVLIAAGTASADPVQFATFNQVGNDKPFTFTNTGAGATFTASTQVSFNFTGIPGLPAELTGDQSATLTLTATASSPTIVNGPIFDQPLNNAVLSFTRNAPSGGLTNLLTVNFSGLLSGRNGSRAATVDASNTSGDTVLFTSSFLDFSQTISRSLALGFSAVTPMISNGPGGFLASFTASGVGTFSSEPPPFVNAIPLPASIVMLGAGLAGVPVASLFRRKKSPVASA